MRIAVISDPHANLAALEAVLADVDADEIWCLGDLVGYGPNPNECCAAVRDRARICLVGNHDLAVLGELDVADFHPDAAAAAEWTRTVLDDGARAFLESLEPTGEAEGTALFHGSPRDPVWEYVLSAEAARAALEATEAAVVLVGHSHVAIAASAEQAGVAPAGYEVDLTTGRWLLNPGSVGQPRDGDPRAAYLVLDLDAGRASFRRVEYDVARTQAEMADRGLPRALADRLAHGV